MKTHFPDPPSPSEPSPKKKTPSQLCFQERRCEEAHSKAADVFLDHEPLVERVDQPNDSDKDDATIGTKTVSTEAAENSASSYISLSVTSVVMKVLLTKELGNTLE